MTVKTNDYLYCIEVVSGKIAKVGVSRNVKGRLQQLANTAPFDLRIRSVVGFQSRNVADAWENYILANATRYRDKGEWVVCDDKLDSLFAEAQAGLGMHRHSTAVASVGRPVPTASSISDVQRVVVRERLIGTDLRGIEFTGEPSDYAPAIIRGRMRQGFGCEDISLMDGFPLDLVRGYFSQIRSKGLMGAVLFAPQDQDRAAS